MKAPNYEITDENDTRILIVDVGPWRFYPTITNNPEPVVEQLAPRLGGRKLHYIDSDGNEDEIIVKDGRFAGFSPVDHL